MPATLTAAQARRIAIAAQGLARPRPRGPVNLGHVRRVLECLGAIQMDSVNVLARAHELALWSRLGAYPRDLLPRLAASGHATELWAHEASIVPVSLHPLLRWRMAQGHSWGSMARLARDKPELLEDVLRVVGERGAITAADLDRTGRSGPWWGWDEAKQALEALFWEGRLAARRRPDFTRVYAEPARFLPQSVLAAPTPARPDAQRELLLVAARALGIATAADLVDYYRLPPREARPLVADLADAGRLLPMRVRGWRDQAYLHPEARIPRRIVTARLVSPFDSLVWFRPRVERVFGFRYRIEIYVPAHKRVHGYYVLPFLLGEHIVARVDLKADRAAGVLRVRAAHREDHADPDEVAEPLAAELAAMAAWLDLGEVEVERRGELAPVLAGVVSRGR